MIAVFALLLVGSGAFVDDSQCGEQWQRRSLIDGAEPHVLRLQAVAKVVVRNGCSSDLSAPLFGRREAGVRGGGFGRVKSAPAPNQGRARVNLLP